MCDLFDREYARGIQIGEQRGIQQGKKQLADLVHKLALAGQLDEVLRVTSDPEYSEKLMKEYGLWEQESLNHFSPS